MNSSCRKLVLQSAAGAEALQVQKHSLRIQMPKSDIKIHEAVGIKTYGLLKKKKKTPGVIVSRTSIYKSFTSLCFFYNAERVGEFLMKLLI